MTTPSQPPNCGKYFRLSERKPLSCNPPDTKYNVLYKGKPVSNPNYATWDNYEQSFCFGWEGHLDKNAKFIEWRLHVEPSTVHSPPPTAATNSEAVKALKGLLNKFKKTRDGGKAYETMDEQFGFPETYIVSLRHDQRELNEKLIEAALRGKV